MDSLSFHNLEVKHLKHKTLVGLVALVGVWLTAGNALPLVNILKMFTPEQLLAARGLLSMRLTTSTWD